MTDAPLDPSPHVEPSAGVDHPARTGFAATLSDWSDLVRLPNVFTVLADVSAAFLLVAGSPAPVLRFVLVVITGVALYWAGMILNDVFDIDRDRHQRPHRPLPSGRIGVAAARRAGWGLIGLAIATSVLAGRAPSIVADAPNVVSTWWPPIIASLCAGCVLLYNGPFKRTVLAPLAMGGCRFFSFLLGASPMIVFAPGQSFPKVLVLIATGFGIYIAGITAIGAREAEPISEAEPALDLASNRSDSHASDLNRSIGVRVSTLVNVGAVLVLIGLITLAFAPAAGHNPVWRLNTSTIFPLVIAMISFPVVRKAFAAAMRPSPETMQAAVKGGVRNIIPLAACFAVLGAGLWGVMVFLLVVPSLALSMRYRVT